MNCDTATELLPWLLNGTLEEGERREVEAHLAGCEACRTALDETRFAWRVSDSHPPASALTALAFGDPMPAGLDQALVGRHVESCPRCAADLELARLSRRLEQEDNVAVMAPAAARRARGGAVWRAGALAASLAGLIAIGGWFMSWQRAETLEGRLAASERTAPAADPRVAELERQLEEARAALAAGQAGDEGNEQVAELRAEIERLQEELATRTAAPQAIAAFEPQLNMPAIDLFPSDAVVRGGEEDDDAVDLPRDGWVMFVLNTRHPATHVELLDPTGRVVWSGSGLEQQQIGGYNVPLPARLLRAGSTLRIYRLEGGSQVGVQTFPVE